MQKREDAHKPSAIVPEDYEYVAQECIKVEGIETCEILMMNRAKIEAHMARTGGTYSGHEHGGNCMVCGSVNAIYTVLFYHKKTNSYIRMGSDCAEKCECGNSADFRYFRTAVQDALARKAGLAKAEATLKTLNLSKAWEIHGGTVNGNEESIIRDIVGKLIQYGGLSEKQIAFVGKLLNQIETRPEREAKKAAEAAAAQPCPSGRVEIRGEVLCTKIQESYFGDTLKMLVRADEGFKVWGSVPNSIDPKKGDVVYFMAQVEPSKDDPKFGFFKRPTRAEVVRAAQ